MKKFLLAILLAAPLAFAAVTCTFSLSKQQVFVGYEVEVRATANQTVEQMEISRNNGESWSGMSSQGGGLNWIDYFIPSAGANHTFKVRAISNSSNYTCTSPYPNLWVLGIATPTLQASQATSCPAFVFPPKALYDDCTKAGGKMQETRDSGNCTTKVECKMPVVVTVTVPTATPTASPKANATPAATQNAPTAEPSATPGATQEAAATPAAGVVVQAVANENKTVANSTGEIKAEVDITYQKGLLEQIIDFFSGIFRFLTGG